MIKSASASADREARADATTVCVSAVTTLVREHPSEAQNRDIETSSESAASFHLGCSKSRTKSQERGTKRSQRNRRLANGDRWKCRSHNRNMASMIDKRCSRSCSLTCFLSASHKSNFI